MFAICLILKVFLILWECIPLILITWLDYFYPGNHWVYSSFLSAKNTGTAQGISVVYLFR